MTIFTDTPVRKSALSEFEAPLGDVLGAQAGQAFEQGLTYIQRAGEFVKQQEGQPRGLFGIAGRHEPETSLLRPEEARDRLEKAGVEVDIPEGGIRGGALDILIETKREEKRRNDIISRGPSGVLPKALGIGASFVGAAADPLNIASAFIPVFGEARVAAMLGRATSAAGRAGVRAGIGAVEGAVGSTILEPFIYSASKQLQADYDITDSLLNIGVGSILGGGLHIGVGAVSDAVSRGIPWKMAKANPNEPLPALLETMDFKSREEALRTGVAQALSGRQIDVEHLIPRAMAPPEAGTIRFYGTNRPDQAADAVRLNPARGRNTGWYVDIPEAEAARVGLIDATGKPRRGRAPAELARQAQPMPDKIPMAPERLRMAEPDSVRAADDFLKRAPDDDSMPEIMLAETMEDVERLADNLGIRDEIARELQPYDDLRASAEVYGRAMQAAANCQLRRGE